MATDIYELLRKASEQSAPSSYDAEVQKRLAEMAQRRAFGATGAPAPAVGVAAPVVDAAPGWGARMARAMPTFAAGANALGGALKAVAPFVLPGVEATRLGMSAMDPAQSAGETALRGAMGGGRLAGASLGARAGMSVPGPALVKGAAALIGGATGYMAPDMAEEAVRWARGYAAPFTPVAVGAAPPGPLPGAPVEEPGQFRNVPMTGVLPSAATGALPAVIPFTAEDIAGTRRPVSGTGAFVNNRTGEVTNLDTRGVAPVEIGYGAQPTSWAESAGGAVGAMMNQRREAATRTSNLATNKMLMDYTLKIPGAQESASKTALHTATLEQAQRAANTGATPSEISLILSGRAPAADIYKGFPTISGDKIDVLSGRTGKVTRETPQVKVTEANIQGFLKDNPKITRAQAIAAHKAKGMDVSGL